MKPGRIPADIEVRTVHGRRVLSHHWPADAAAARALQRQLTIYVDTRCALGDVATIAGVDIGFEDGGQTTRAAVVVLDASDLSRREQALVRQPTRMPYVPGLLSFREVPAALAALAELAEPPDLLMVDGHGIAHPRRVGVATHLGLVSGLPSIGVAKKRLTGRHDPAPEPRLAWTPLRDGDETIGAVLRSRRGVQPIFISAGHAVDLQTALEWTRRTLSRYRLPEPTRAADGLASNRNPRPAVSPDRR